MFVRDRKLRHGLRLSFRSADIPNSMARARLRLALITFPAPVRGSSVTPHFKSPEMASHETIGDKIDPEAHQSLWVRVKVWRSAARIQVAL